QFHIEMVLDIATESRTTRTSLALSRVVQYIYASEHGPSHLRDYVTAFSTVVVVGVLLDHFPFWFNVKDVVRRYHTWTLRADIRALGRAMQKVSTDEEVFEAAQNIRTRLLEFQRCTAVDDASDGLAEAALDKPKSEGWHPDQQAATAGHLKASSQHIKEATRKCVALVHLAKNDAEVDTVATGALLPVFKIYHRIVCNNEGGATDELCEFMSKLNRVKVITDVWLL
ncbi:hypothetical protein As57867_004438, partial [Aphanomyces stellatus]